MEWHNLLTERKSYPVPSIHHQTLLSKAIFEHCIGYAQAASIILASKSIQNSSLAPNFATNVALNNDSIVLFSTVFHPSSSLPIQFVPELTVHCMDNTWYMNALKSQTRYFHKSLRTLTLHDEMVSAILLPNSDVDHENNEDHQIHFASLHTLNLFDCMIDRNMPNVINSAFPSLETVNIIFTRHVDDDDCSAANACKIEKLAMFHSDATLFFQEGDHHDEQQLIMQNLFSSEARSSLVALNLTNMSASPDSFSEIVAQLVNLKTLELSEYDCLTDETARLFASSLHQLVTIDFSRCKNITDAAIHIICDSPYLSSAVTDLYLASCSLLTNNCLSRIGNLSPTLRSLNLKRCSLVTDEGMKEISKCKNLTYLNLEEMSLTNRESVMENFSGKSLLPHLATLNIARTTIHAQAVIAFASSFPNLTELDIHECTNVRFTQNCDDDDDENRDSEIFKKLTKLNFSEGEVSSQSFKMFPNLTWLDLTGCFLADISGSHALELPKCLQVLNLGRIDEKVVNDELLQKILTDLPFLRWLDIFCCRGVTEKSVRQNVKRIAKLGFFNCSACCLSMEVMQLLKVECKLTNLVL